MPSRLLAGIVLGAILVCVPRVLAEEKMPTEGVVDIHAHIGEFRGFAIGLAPLVENIQRYKVRLALVSNINGANLPGVTKNLDEIQANEETAAAVARYSFLRGLAWARPADAGGSASNLEPFLRDKGFVGIKFHPKFNQFRADDPRVDAYLDLCEKYGVPAVFHCGMESECHPRTIYRLAKRHPKVAVVLYHMVFFGDSRLAIEVAEEAKAKNDARIYLETSQTKADAILDAIRRLGSVFVLFGTDATYYGEDHYKEYFETLNMLKKELSSEDYERVVSGNAFKLFRLH